MDRQTIDNYLDSIINTMNDGLIVISPDGKIRMVNQAFEDLTGYQAAEVIDQPCTLLSCDACELAIKSGEGQFWWCALFDPTNEGMKRCRCNYRRKDGTHVPVLKNASVLRDEHGLPLGAVETLTDISELDRLDQEVILLSRHLDSVGDFMGLVGKSPVMEEVYQLIRKAGRSEAPVAIYGESGTGKELVARAIHQIGGRREGPFVQLSCAALNESLLESELFGHARGAFTGAHRDRIGRFEAANGGDLFLDEVGDIPLTTQVKLLRVLESQIFERVGDHQPIKVDVRIITATNRSLEAMIAERSFREDLFFRINVIPIHLPPLRDRLEDLPALVNVFIGRLTEQTGKKITRLSGPAMDLLMNHAWPGNVRELKGVLEYAFVVAEEGLIRPEHLPPKLTGAPATQAPAQPGPTPTTSGGSLSEKEVLVKALEQANGSQTEAAKLLGVSRATVYNRMRKHGVALDKRIKTGS